MYFQGLGECIRGRDFISRLPDDILVQILSCLETKDAVKTCVLSSRRKNLWTFIYNLHFDDFNRKHYVERKVRKLTFIVDIEEIEWWVVRLPQSILTCNTLKELCILSDFVFDIPDSKMCFPSLKLFYIRITNPVDDLMQKLFRSCPVLEDLSIHGDLVRNEDALTFDIMVPTLKRLTIRLSMNFYYFEGVSEHKFVVTIKE
ncbi:hypothetical protein Dsin_007369 [Dipteronia sinensis]|uniref:F-box domain-containing protein n=1 Tax=Dipteronia sinensis TaxID=43782 RepID=A0AAE0B0F7_9ROSI|nr:hypothetical protein Dsin_007369 [Dipteronia sinensis]